MMTDISTPRRSPLLLLLLGMACSDAPEGDVVTDPKLGEAPPLRIVPASTALSQAALPTIDPHTMVMAEAERALPGGVLCRFDYTVAGGPVLAAGMTASGEPAAVVKINGRLVMLSARTGSGPAALTGGGIFSADGLRFTVDPEDPAEPGEEVEADMVMNVRDELVVGYGGYYRCD